MVDLKGALNPLPPTSLRLRIFDLVWQIFIHLMLPLALLHFLWKSRREPLYRKHFTHRFGMGPVGPKGSVWVFATSLGETRAVAPLIEMLLNEGHTVALTHSSPAGLAEGHRLFDDPRITHSYVPFDHFWSTLLFLARLRPCVGIVVEGEFWPGHLQFAGWMGIPMVHVNGNLNERSLRRGQGLGRVRFDILARFRAILTKSEGHRERYLKAGVPDERILIVGELKFDQKVDPAQLTLGDDLKAAWSRERPVFLIASSVEEEEADLLALVKDVASLPTAPRIIWAPRSPQRFDAVAEALSRAGLTVARRSELASADDLPGVSREDDVIVGDSIGEMNIWYQASDLVFVGATLADKGGHNISEPLALGRPVILGPSIFGITFPAEDAERDGAVRILPDAEATRSEVKSLLSQPSELAEFTQSAASFARKHVGATDRTLYVINRILGIEEKPLKAAIQGRRIADAAIVVLGHEMNSDGLPDAETMARLERATGLFKDMPNAVLVTSGWAYRDDTDLSLAEAVAQAAQTQYGVPNGKIVAIPSSRDTVGDAVFSCEAVKAEKVVVVTRQYHTERARQIFRFVLPEATELDVIGTGEAMTPERDESEQESLAAFENTFAGIEPGDFPAILQRLKSAHLFYNGSVDVKSLRRHG
jgi:3-deoxy-D-manno-octulosonic-acid transferase